MTRQDKEQALLKRLAEKTSSETKVRNARGRLVGSVKMRAKNLNDGKISLYLDIYANKKRTYQFLEIHLDPSLVKSMGNVGTANENGIISAELERLDAMERLRTGIATPGEKVIELATTPLSSWMANYAESRRESGRSGSNADGILRTAKHLEQYAPKAALADIDKNFAEGFKKYLCEKSGLSANTQNLYFKLFKAALAAAVKNEILATNPIQAVNAPKGEESNRAFLDIDELKAMIATDCPNPEIKKAYLFSCFTGLRHSDLYALTWGNVTNRNGQAYLEIKVKKTARPLAVPLSPEALRWLGNRNGASDTAKVFKLVERSDKATYTLQKWAEAAGVKKHLTMHTARHTFATLELTAGADLYTTAKLLGHTNVTVTQVYAKIVDRKKEEAVGMVSNLFQ